MLDSVSTPVVEIKGATISDGYHNLSHHGKSEAKLAQLRVIDSWHMRLLADLFKGLKAVQENGETLLDRSMVLYGSGTWATPTPTPRQNMPVLLVRRRHSPRWTPRVRPQSELPASELICFHASTHGDWCISKFASSTGTMSGLRDKESMTRGAAKTLLIVLSAAVFAAAAQEGVVDFENTVPLLADRKANRVPQYEEKGVVFTLAREPKTTKAKGMLMFFTHLSNGLQGNRLRDGNRTDSRSRHASLARSLP